MVKIGTFVQDNKEFIEIENLLQLLDVPLAEGRLEFLPDYVDVFKRLDL
jgi:hypothetical protein